MIRKLLTNKKLLLSLVLFFTFFINYGQSASNYCFTARSGTYPTLTGTTNVPGLAATDDEAVSNAITLPFNFTFGGSAYNQVKVSSNGWLTFGSTTNAAYVNTSGNAASSKPILFPLWDDLQNRTIPRYVVSGSAPNRIFKLEWSQQEWDFNANNDVISFQVWLYETSNVIEYYYKQGGTAVNNGSASIGIYDANDTYLTLNTPSAAPTAQSSTFTTSISAKPATNQIYSFAPPTTISQAGADQYKNTPFTLAANAAGSGNTGTWSIVSGPSTSTSQFSDVSSPTALFTPSGSGTWALNWTITNGCWTSTDQVLITNCAGNSITNGDFSGGATSWTPAINSKGPVSGTSYVEVLNEKVYFGNNNDDNTAELDSQASLGQTVSVIPNVQYTLNFLYARRPGSPATVAVDVRVYEGGSITASKNITTSDTNNTPQVGTLTFTPTSSSIVLEFFNSLGGSSTLGSIVDNIVLVPSTQVVPIAITNPKGSYKTLTVCVGGSAGLDVDNISASGVTYAWSTPSAGTSFTTATNIKSPAVTFTTTGMKEFKVLATNSSGCGNVSSSTFVYVVDLPVVYNVTGGGPYCSGGTGVLVGLDGSASSSLNISYQLQRDGVDVAGAVVTGTGSAISFGLQTVAGTYTVVAKNAGCTLNMNGSPVISITTPPTVSITGSSNICVNGTTKLSPTTGGTWVSNNPLIASVTNSGDVVGLATGTATFTFTSNIAPNCSATTAAVNVSSSTIVFDSTGSYTIPAGVTNIQVECWGAGGGGGGASNNPSAGGGGAGGSYVKNASFTVTPNTAYTINVGTGGTVSTTAGGGTGGSSWFGSATTIVAVGGRGGLVGNNTTNNGTGGTAVSTGNVGGTTTSTYGAAGGSANLTGTNRIAGSGSAGANGGAIAAGTTTNGKGADGNAPGGGGAGGRNTNGTNSSGGVGGMGRVTITLPTPTASAGGSQTICQTGTALVSGANATNGTILWSHNGAGSLSNATTLAPTYTAASGDAGNAVVLTMTVSNGPCLVTTATYTVNVTPTVGTPTAITPASPATATICQGSANTTYTTSATNATSYTWSVSGTGNTISGSGTTGTVTWAAGFSGPATVSVVANGCGTSSTVSTTITVTPTVGTPTAITPASPATATICQGSGNTTYTTSATNATSYTWSVSGTGNTISGSGTTGTVTWAAGFSGPATVSVKANGCGTSSTVSTTITVTPTVGTPTAITPASPATATICQGSANTTYTTSATNATSYTWSVSGTGNTISGSGTTGTVTWAAGFSGPATVSVVANGCGTSSTVSTTITVTPTVGTPTAITPASPATATICQGSGNTTYTTSATNATSYTWSVSGTGNTISGSGTTGTVTWAAGFSGPATVSVKANGCGTSSTVSTTITVTPTVGTPTAITPASPATATICQGSANTTYTTSATNATSYTWSVSGTGNTISGTGTTGTVTWAAGFSGPATVSVVANGCGTSSTVSTTITVTPTVGTPTAITPASPATATICQGSANTTYTTSATNATSYTWSVSGTGNTISGSGTTGTVTWAAGFSGPATVSVVANGCGTSSTVSTTITVTPTVGTPTAITPASPATATICQGSANTTYTTSATNATSYTWSVSGTGNTISGSGTTGTVTWAAGFSGPATVSVKANGCGTSSTVSTTITVTPTVGTPTAITPASPATATICQGSANTTYTTSATNATSYTWSVSGTGNTISGSGTTGTVTWAAGFSGPATVSVVANGCGTSSTVSTTVTVTPTLSAVGISPTGGQALCLIGTGTLLTVAETGGGTISRQWGKRLVSGGAITNISGQTAQTFTPTGANLGVGDWLIVCTSTPSCGSAIISNEVSVKVSPDLPASVNIAASPSGAICAGTLVTFTATPTNGGTTPTYQWYNGLTAVGTGSTYSSSTLANGDAIKVVMTSNASPCLTGSPATSNTITMSVNALPGTPSPGTPTQPTCASPVGSVLLSNLPSSGTWTITQSGFAPGSYNGTGTTYNVQNLAPGNYTFTVVGAANSCSSLASTNVTINVSSSKVWTGNSDANWSNPANWNPSGIPLPSDCVVIPDASVVLNVPTITGAGVVANAFTLNVNDNASLTVNSKNTLRVVGSVTVAPLGSLVFKDEASLVQTTNATNTGNITYNRNTEPIRRYDFTYWSTPITNTAQPYKLKDLSPGTLLDKYQSYNSTTSSWDIHLNGLKDMEPAVGYAVRAPQTFSITAPIVYPAVFTGTPNNGDYTVAIYGAKWSLIGNPYPSAIDAEKLIQINHDASPSVDVGSLYFWTHNSPPSSTPSAGGSYDYTSNDYAVFNLSGSTGTGPTPPPTGDIASCQSFFMLASAPGVVKFTNDMRVDGRNEQFFKTAKTNAIEKNRVWLNLTSNQGAFKQVLVGYIEGATNDWDVNYDAATNNGNSFVDFYSINQADKLIIQGRALPFADTDRVPLGYKTTVAGDFIIAIDHADGLFNNQAVYLEDKTTGKVTDLKAGNYTFTTAIGTFTDRFTIAYTKKTLGTGDFENLENTVFVSIKDKTIKVTSSKETIKEVTIYDINGQLLYNKKKIDVNELQIPNLQSSNQVLLVKVTLDNGFTTTKKIIFQ